MSFGGAVKLTGETEYKRALSQITQNLREVASEMKVVSSSFDKNDKSQEALAEQSRVLNKQLDEQKKKLGVLQGEYDRLQKSFSENEARHKNLVLSYISEKEKLAELARTLGTTSDEYKAQKAKVEDLAEEVRKSTRNQEDNEKAMSRMREEINKAQADCNNTAKAIDNLGKETKETGEEAEDASEGFTVFKGTLANLAASAITAAVDGLVKLGKALIDVGKQAVANYGEYEQLAGGVETLFGDSAKTVEEYADRAYKTAGLSANEYMKTVTSFSASLLQSLDKDTEAAAKYADMAIVDMADNANKMGTSIDSLQNAYRGFSRGTFTMLDNLALGYSGSRSEMERLIADANKVKEANGEMANLSIERFADMVEAIHIIQTELGITGTTSKEAAGTIQGSAGSMRAAWDNLLTGIADDNKDMGQLVDNFIDTLLASADNVIPRVKKVVEGIKRLVGAIVTDVFPRLKKEIPALSPLISTFEWFIKYRNVVVSAVAGMVGAFATKKLISFAKSAADVVKSVVNIAKKIVTATVAKTADTAAEQANTQAKVANTAAEGANAAASGADAAAKGAEAAATNTATGAQIGLNTAMSANPIGLVLTAIAGLITALITFASVAGNATEAQKEYKESLDDLAEGIHQENEAYRDAQESREKAVTAHDYEIERYKDLWKELQNITDENGNVKKGYEERAKFITGELKEALGIEMQYQDGVIENYKEIRKSILDLIESKRAQFILEKQEEAYKTALEEKDGAMRQYVDANREYNNALGKQTTLLGEIAELTEEYNKAFAEGNTNRADLINGEIVAKQEQLKTEKEFVLQTKQALDEAKQTYEGYLYDISVYEENYKAFSEKRYGDMIEYTSEYVAQFATAKDKELAILRDQYRNQVQYVKDLERLNEESGNNLYQTQLENAKKRKEELKNELQIYKTATAEGLEGTSVVWNDGIASMLEIATRKDVEFRKTADGYIQMFINGVKEGDEKTEKEMEKYINDIVLKVTDGKPDMYKSAVYLIEGFNNGLANPSARNAVMHTIDVFGVAVVNELRKAVKENSPSKATAQIGEYFVEGFGVGLDREEDSVLSTVARLGKEIIDTMQSELSDGVSLGSIDYGAVNVPQISRRVDFRAEGQERESMVAAFKEALSEMKIELDDEVAGKFVERTVERAVYNF